MSHQTCFLILVHDIVTLLQNLSYNFFVGFVHILCPTATQMNCSTI